MESLIFLFLQTNYHHDMRKAFIIIVITIIATNCICIVLPHNKRPFCDTLKEAVNTCELATYTDEDFGFTARYPAFFIQEDKAGDGCIGHARFSYWDHWIRIVMECYVTHNRGNLSVRDGMRIHARRMRAQQSTMGRDWFIVSGPLYENGSPIHSYSYHTKYVRNGSLWFVYALYYPDAYRPSLARIFRIIDRWNVWDDRHPQQLDFIRHRKYQSA
jgi:hypothetical protein